MDGDIVRLVNLLGPRLYRFFLASRTKPIAEELVQEVFARLMTAHYSPDLGSMETLAWGIARNINRETRRKTARSEILMDDLPEVAANDFRTDDIEALRRGIELLSDPQKEIMQFVLADLSIRQISEMMAMPVGTVKSHISRAKDNIRDTFKKWRIL